MELVRIDESQIEVTSKFAQRVFIEYYTDRIGKDQSEYMAELFLSEDAIRKLIQDGAVFKLVVEDGQILGFYECKKEESRVFLSKLYVDKPYRSKGIGKLMFEDLLDYTRSCGLNKIYLTVNKYNTPSYNIYLHLGFKVIDAVVNDIGHGYVMDDYIMEYTIA
ncbi:MAG: GNAT family N-acetyltransferase [Erysipelotrichaceae bacterium]|nr:GNAT family N-acetyltransferase [Erysipelotrichaceae bacterium]